MTCAGRLCFSEAPNPLYCVVRPEAVSMKLRRRTEVLSAKYCRRQAEECLRLAEHRWSSKGKQRTRDAAAVWEQLARQAEEREQQTKAQGNAD
jgi:hypothetical protein